ncbi:hypothetical protein NLU13_6562 [Sarocladium strictum]|uniref:Fungal calcium binding protein domain-containing protein n=1 Tax=Sarocladium strictum TaxID=5046 RepID=A0AA39GIK1_SARSR|nr:hypothetical protein NLU13_6562 [Sarocladium strictum]
MKTSTILVALFSATSMASTIPLVARQDLLPQNVQALDTARNDAAAAINRGQGKGRLLLDEGGCQEACQRCRTSAVATAVAEVFACGTAAVAIDVLTAGIATFLEVAGFAACEAAVVASLNEKEETCLKD